LSFFEVSDLDPYSALWRVLFATGVRPSEAFGLTREDVDLEKGRIHIRRALRWTRDEDGNRIHVLGLPKTKKSKREIRIGPKLAGILRAHLETVEDDPGALVFLSKKSSKNPGGGPLDRNNIAKRFLRIAKTAGLADLGASLYSARHTFCTLQLAAGTHYKAVAAAMGHKSPSLVLERYSHALPSQLDTVADTMDAMF